MIGYPPYRVIPSSEEGRVMLKACNETLFLVYELVSNCCNSRNYHFIDQYFKAFKQSWNALLELIRLLLNVLKWTICRHDGAISDIVKYHWCYWNRRTRYSNNQITTNDIDVNRNSTKLDTYYDEAAFVIQTPNMNLNHSRASLGYIYIYETRTW